LNFKIRNILSIFFICIVLLSILRVILYISYFDYFSTLDLYDTILSFLMGIRVDIIVLCAGFCIFILILFLPFKFTFNRYFQNSLYLVLYLVFLIIVFIWLCNFVYFEHVNRHISNEITAFSIKNDIHIFIDMMVVHFDKLILFFLFSIGLYYIFKKNIFITKNLNKKIYIYTNSKYLFIKNLVIFLFIFILLLIGIRSNISGKPFGLSDAFITNKTQSGILAINPIFSLIKSIKTKQKIYNWYEYNDALNILKYYLKSDEFIFDESHNSSYPLQRKVVQKSNITKKHNIVIIMLESWSNKYIDSFSNSRFKVTKNFDKLAQNGIKFSNFFANGQRSIEGITALFTGIPVLSGFNYLGDGLELSKLSYLGSIAKDNGYSTLSMQSSKRGSYRVDTISNLAGFDSYYGAQDIPSLYLETSGKKPKFGVWDNDMLSFYHQKINSLKEPFLSFAFTSSTHAPFISPGKKWEKYKHNENSIYGYLNTLNYADEALGNFMKKAKSSSWFDNTIFIFLADHTIGFGSDESLLKNSNISIKNRVLENMRIPLLIYAPKIFKPQTISRLTSQVDILPTLSSYLNWNSTISTIGNSIFSTSSKEFILFSYGNIVGFINKYGYIKHTLQKELENSMIYNGSYNKKDLNSTKELLSIYQILSNSLRNNKLLK